MAKTEPTNSTSTSSWTRGVHKNLTPKDLGASSDNWSELFDNTQVRFVKTTEVKRRRAAAKRISLGRHRRQNWKTAPITEDTSVASATKILNGKHSDVVVIVQDSATIVISDNARKHLNSRGRAALTTMKQRRGHGPKLAAPKQSSQLASQIINEIENQQKIRTRQQAERTDKLSVDLNLKLDEVPSTPRELARKFATAYLATVSQNERARRIQHNQRINEQQTEALASEQRSIRKHRQSERQRRTIEKEQRIVRRDIESRELASDRLKKK